MTAEEFYRLRDDRTNRIVPSRDYHQLRVRIVAEQKMAFTFTGQVQLLLTANMMARWCRRVEFGFSDAPLQEELRRNNYETLHERIRAEVHQADPFGSFTFSSFPSPDIQYTLKIGAGNLEGEPIDFTVDSDGWLVYGGRGSQIFDIRERQLNPVGPAFAACVGVADAFKVANNLSANTRAERSIISVFDFSVGRSTTSSSPNTMPGTIRAGHIQMIGVGSVGSAVVYLLDMLPLAGALTLIDCDTVGIENLNRSPLFGIQDVGKTKVDVAVPYFADKLSILGFSGRYDQFIEEYGRQESDLILPLANEYGVRPTIEHNFPPLQIYGTTTSDWGINYHRHIPMLEDCSVCRFPISDKIPTFVCSKTRVDAGQEKQIDAALPFLSVAAATLTVADLIKLQLDGYPFTPNFAFMDFKGPFEAILTYNKSPRSGCLCSSRSSSIHSGYIAPTLFS